MTQYIQISGAPPDTEKCTVTVTSGGGVTEGMSLLWGDRRFSVIDVERLDGFSRRVTLRRRRVEPEGVIVVDECHEPDVDQPKRNAIAHAKHLQALRRRRGGY